MFLSCLMFFFTFLRSFFNPLTAKNIDLRVWPFKQPMLELTFWGFQNGMTLEDQSKGSKVRDFQSIEGKNGNIFWYRVEMVRIKRGGKIANFVYFCILFYFSISVIFVPSISKLYCLNLKCWFTTKMWLKKCFPLTLTS